MNYFTVDEIHQHAYLIVPKELFLNKDYKNLTNDARITYAFLLDRMKLSVKNGWHDKDGRVYLIYTRESLSKVANVSLRTMIRVMKTLNEYKLIEEKRQGLNKPNMIYIGKIEYSASKRDDKKDVLIDDGYDIEAIEKRIEEKMFKDQWREED